MRERESVCVCMRACVRFFFAGIKCMHIRTDMHVCVINYIVKIKTSVVQWYFKEDTYYSVDHLM